MSSTGTLTLDKLTIRTGNLGATYAGGGIYSDGILSITNSTLSGNTAPTGGALYVATGTATVLNSTFSGNTATDGGGAAVASGATLTASFATFSGNTASGSGAGFYNNGGTVTLRSSIVAPDSYAGGFTDGGQNYTSGDPQLGPLQNNGGSTFTMLPAPSSPVIDLATTCTDAASNPVTLDQRALARPSPLGGSCDAGAAEARYATVLSINRSGSNPSSGTTVNFTVTFSDAVSGVTASNFDLTTMGNITGASVASVGSGTTSRTVTVNTGSGDGIIRLNMQNDTGITGVYDIINLPFTSGQYFTIDKGTAGLDARLQRWRAGHIR